MNILKKASPNYNERVGDVSPRYIILHYTGTETAKEASDVYMDKDGGLSPHYMVDVDGSVTQFVEESARAWHAGKSFWEGEEDLNSLSIGIEIVNGGHYKDHPEFPAEQIEAVIALCRQIIGRHDIKPINVIGHSDIATGRRFDPGPLFPWSRLAQNGVGFWPEPEEGDFQTDIGVRSGLLKFGYTDQCEDVVLVREFQRHYEPELFSKGLEGQVSERTRALIACLLRQKQL